MGERVSRRESWWNRSGAWTGAGWTSEDRAVIAPVRFDSIQATLLLPVLVTTHAKRGIGPYVHGESPDRVSTIRSGF